MIHKKKLIFGMISQCCNILSPFCVIFICSKYLSADLSSIWILFLSTTALLFLFDFGLSPNIIRNVSYLVAGAKNLSSQGIKNISLGNNINHSLLNRMVYDFKNIYFLLSVLGLFIIGLGGYFYFKLITPASLHLEVFGGWIVFVSALILNIKYFYFIPLLIGLGKIASTYTINIVSKSTWVILTLITINFTTSLTALSICYLISTVLGRVMMHYYLNYNDNVWLTGKYIDKDKNSTLPYVFTNTWKLGVVSICSFIINRITIYLSGIIDNLDTAARYALSIQMLFAIMGIVNILLAQSMPMLSQVRIRNDMVLLKKVVYKVYAFICIAFIVISSVFILTQDWLLSLFKINIAFLPENLLWLLSIIFLLELSHSTCATIITTKNEIPFMKSAVFSALGVILLAFVFTFYFNWGILGLILAQGIVQLSYNNWKWPKELYTELK